MRNESHSAHPVIAICRNLLVLLAITVWTVSGASAQDAVSEAETTATQQVIEDQLLAFRAGEHQRAFSHAAPNIKGIFRTVENFAAMVQRGYGAIYEAGEFTFGRNLFQNGEIYQEVLITDSAGKQWQAVYTLKQQEDGSWKITGVKMNPYKGASV